jgi:hypothetical protein
MSRCPAGGAKPAVVADVDPVATAGLEASVLMVPPYFWTSTAAMLTLAGAEELLAAPARKGRLAVVVLVLANEPWLVLLPSSVPSIVVLPVAPAGANPPVAAQAE